MSNAIPQIGDQFKNIETPALKMEIIYEHVGDLIVNVSGPNDHEYGLMADYDMTDWVLIAKYQDADEKDTNPICNCDSKPCGHRHGRHIIIDGQPVDGKSIVGDKVYQYRCVKCNHVTAKLGYTRTHCPVCSSEDHFKLIFEGVCIDDAGIVRELDIEPMNAEPITLLDKYLSEQVWGDTAMLTHDRHVRLFWDWLNSIRIIDKVTGDFVEEPPAIEPEPKDTYGVFEILKMVRDGAQNRSGKPVELSFEMVSLINVFCKIGSFVDHG